jgi:hypothetical protein
MSHLRRPCVRSSFREDGRFFADVMPKHNFPLESLAKIDVNQSRFRCEIASNATNISGSAHLQPEPSSPIRRKSPAFHKRSVPRQFANHWSPSETEIFAGVFHPNQGIRAEWVEVNA